jgi:hypothetical protein
MIRGLDDFKKGKTTIKYRLKKRQQENNRFIRWRSQQRH